MATSRTPDLFVVDGSNIATEGRSTPSLEQLNDAVLAFLEDRPGVRVTVVVDATFGHRIDKKEVNAFDEAVANNELVTPPAGAVGRGDAFVLSIAHKAKAGVLSNDSFQEFHGEYDWLFDDGRLVGGKPVPHVGWVFVDRTPVRGPKSRQAVREAKEDATDAKERAKRRVRKKADSEAPAAEPAPEAPEVASGRNRRGRRRRGGDQVGAEQQATIEAAKAAGGREQVNDLVPFLEFVERHPVGTSCTGVVESYASHGAYARVDDVLIYIPLRLMDDPPPRSARSVLKTGEAVALVIVGYVPDRRSVDAALPHMSTDGETPVGPVGERAAVEPEDDGAATEPPAPPAPAKQATSKQAPAKQAAAKSPAKRAAAKPAKKRAAEKAAPARTDAPAAADEAATATAAAATAAPEQAPTTESKQAPAKTSAAKRSSTKKSTAKKSTAKKSTAKKSTAKKSAATTAAAKQPSAKKSTAKKSAAKKSTAKKSAAKTSSANKSTAKKSAAKKSVATPSTAKRSAASEPSAASPTERSRQSEPSAAGPARRRSRSRRPRSGAGES